MNIISPVQVTDAVLTSSDVPENDAPEFDIGTTYALNDKVMVTTAGVHSVYVSLIASNTGNQPEDDDPVNPQYWARVSATNRWAMFSDQISDRTEQAAEINVSLSPGALVNALSFFSLDAVEVTVVMTDPSEGEVYSRTFELVDASGVNTWYDWYFEPIVRQSDLAVLDLPPYPSADIDVTISNPSGVAKLGLFDMGVNRRLGDADFGTSVGIQDYSRKERDTFGNPVVVRRNFSKRADFTVTVDTNYVSEVQRILAANRTTPITWIGSTEYGATIVYGYYRDFNIILSNYSKSLLNVEVEGLT